ncbi:MAG: trypsin-like serine protease, partial [Myxococcales bacterium]|nr:trypsin-like serine protease [Myxococcales bacterium]
MTIRKAISGWRHLLTLAALALGAYGCAGDVAVDVDPPESESSAARVQVILPDGLDVDETLRADLDSLEDSLREMSEMLGSDGSDEPIVVRYRGVGDVVDGDAEAPEVIYADDEIDEVAEPVDPRSQWVTVNLSTGHEFEVTFPAEVLDRADARAHDEALDLGSLDRHGLEADENPVDPIPEIEGGPDGVTHKGWSNGVDTRSLMGTYNVAHTHTAYRRIVSLGTNGGCSGTLVGPKHIVTAAHCIRDFRNRRWVGSTAYAGRSGQNAWRSSAGYNPDPKVASTWYWVPGGFLSRADGQTSMPFSATPWDIGVLVTHSSRLGDAVGWMGWYWWGSDSDFGNRTRYNRGYPVCGRDNSPASCRTLGLYGDSRWCATGEYSSPDGDGINRRFRFHCDISGGHSGSSLYHYLDGDTLVVTGIVSWEHCKTCSANDDRPNTGVRITKEYSGVISSLRQMF